MRLSLRSRIVLTALPQLVLLAILGGIAVVLIYRLGNSINLILRENYDSVRYMERLKETLERIDSSFTFALADHEDLAKKQYDKQWEPFMENLKNEQNNITIHPKEDQLVESLAELGKKYRKAGDAFFGRPRGDPGRKADYFEQGLLNQFKEIKGTADDILKLNQEHMEEAGKSARDTARNRLSASSSRSWRPERSASGWSGARWRPSLVPFDS